MKINPDAPWYPIVGNWKEPHLKIEPGVTIHLHLMESAMQSLINVSYAEHFQTARGAEEVIDEAYRYADEAIKRANRDEESEPARHASEKADPSLCGYVSSGAEAVEAIRADAEEVMGSLARGVAALNHEEGDTEETKGVEQQRYPKGFKPYPSTLDRRR